MPQARFLVGITPGAGAPANAARKRGAEIAACLGAKSIRNLETNKPAANRPPCADLVEKRFEIGICAILIPPAGSTSIKDSNRTHRRFKDCVTLVCAGVFQQNPPHSVIRWI